jgi:WhiB family redox-sensing transcriptional regulator
LRFDEFVAEGGGDVHVRDLVGGLAELVDLVERSRPWWWDRAACRGAAAGISWFPTGTDRATMTTAAKAAKTVCETCPVRTSCRDWAVAQGSRLYGIWGGLDEKERDQVRRQLRREDGRRAS